MDSHFRGNDSNIRFLTVSFLRKQESRKIKSIVTMKYKEDTIFTIFINAADLIAYNNHACFIDTEVKCKTFYFSTFLNTR